MAATGYSGTPLLKKLGIKPEMKILVLNAPGNYFDLLEQDITTQMITGKQVPDFVHLFAKDSAAFTKGMQKILPYAKANTSVVVWVSWYKKTSGMATDITEDSVRNFALLHDLVDIKVCAVSDQWSGLKLVVPVAKR